ncbi:MAG: type II toxin-antitoxin system RelE/ParE family toxin [Candidatus Vogelbacteria bacterium]|nr:type II toxin-antitoxin system RelE/ParE family toxin [Candidatus Vogelbacteria bacterium]
MLKFIYTPVFIRQLKKLDEDLLAEVLEKMEMFKNVSSHKSLKVHKLNGKYRNCYSFSVNYEFRVIFSYGKKNVIEILTIGDHSIYK